MSQADPTRRDHKRWKATKDRRWYAPGRQILRAFRTRDPYTHACAHCSQLFQPKELVRVFSFTRRRTASTFRMEVCLAPAPCIHARIVNDLKQGLLGAMS